ncbi:poly [ADP-ribose] polymerase-like [Contarinia nasturtii]|uniref:poly [ADP-ribose] polymerase-like n=1 Tax=Contarinia nasturtii TaxID=265458 RepID=UPI0012D46F00|nr:poly [ADP-ribose] polymerase-like [Contarinia nasturtii]
MDNSLPYKVLYSTGEQICYKCLKKILVDCIKIAIMLQSDDEDYRFPAWYHQICFFKTRLPQTEAAFDGFAKLRYIDQLAIKENLGTVEYEPIKLKQPAKLPDFYVEYARSGKASCEGCQKKICEREIRIMKVIIDTNRETAIDGKATWYHVVCFARARSQLGWPHSAELLPGFKRLSDYDKETIKNQIPVMKRIYNRTEQTNGIKLDELEKDIEHQSIEYYKLYDKLARNVSKEYQVMFLEENNQIVPKAECDILHHLSDVIIFGALQPCKQCGNERMIFSNSTYVCAYINDWGKCGWETREPERYVAKIPHKFTNKYPSLKIKPSVRKRVYHVFRLTDENGTDLIYAPYKHPPLFLMEFAIIGILSKSAKEIEKEVRKMGGKVVNKIHSKVAAVISSSFELLKSETSFVEAKHFNIQVVSEEFLTEAQINDPILYIKTKCISDWGGDPYSRIEKSDEIRREDEFYTKSLPDKITYKWRDGPAVDPECGLDEIAHVYCCATNRGELEYSAVLGLVDIENNRNSYYRMQLLESNEQQLHSRYWIFEAWGRISTVIGSKRLQTFDSLEEARTTFNTIYEEKTGNPFELKQFIKWPEKYYHLDIDFGINRKMPNTFVNSKLSLPVYQLMEMLFNINQMENMMLGCDVDLKQMPLGKISAQGIRSAMTVLRDIVQLIRQNDSYSQLREASNKFYTLIPHAFGIKRPPVINSIDVVNAKNEMLESLLNMELIYGFLEGENGEKTNPLDACYLKLKADIVAVDKNSDEFKKINEIAKTTHGPTHKNYRLEVLEIFKVRRHGEDNRFQAWQGVSNQRLLWHGSRLMNFVSILSNGLKVAPPEATHTGYMFGKGIYFADAISKSANYCMTDKTNDIGLILLCEVALGQCQYQYAANHKITNIPNLTEHSVQGCGTYVPSKTSIIDGIPASTGNFRKNSFITALFYNEYIVYDPAQVKIKYLIKLKFNYI